ncbi:ATP-dependent zinc protease [Marinobacter confluentis]|uniref:ATP-dependent zinc protease n=2 Tax=Marinobacter confluentis TaxID=1697557 RepID=A0A4Z1CAN8_9GAMM|nr:ATP-dependent zinc protease [Marinobacter confluentis]
MVEKKDIDQLDQSVSEQSERITSLENEALTQFGSMAMMNQANTETILEAISEQAEQLSCPPVPEKPACTVTPKNNQAANQGRTDRLKGKVVVGELENFYLADPGIVHVARIDSGAETSSLDARNITRFERDGNNWVRFDVPLPDSDDFVTLEREVSRRVKIIQSSTDDVDRRVVVELQFMIGNHHQKAEFTLTNREHLSHVVLVGRNILRDVMLIDVGKEYATELPSPLPHQDDSE